MQGWNTTGDGVASDPLELLVHSPSRQASLVHLVDLPARQGTSAPWPEWADPRVVEGYRRLGVERPWRHQVAAAQSVHEGTHTVLATATGSGKSLAAWLPVISAMASGDGESGSVAQLRRRPTALYLAPTKALAADQVTALEEVLGAAGLSDRVRAATCDGDTPLPDRDWVRAHADIVLTNPDFLHFTLLPGHERWARVLRGLRFVVLDECHAYRGVLGAHVALVLRRLLRLARSLGAQPVVIAASATTGEPESTLARLVGVPAESVHAVTDNTAPAGRRRIALWEPPPLGDGRDPRDPDPDPWRSLGEQVPDDAPRRSAAGETTDLLCDLVTAGQRTLAFVRSRAGVEAVASAASHDLARRGIGEGITDDRDAVAHLAEGGSIPVAAYRGGYLPEERRTLERALREGRLLGLASTNALELGIDVSGLDVVLMSGWPGTRVSFWQQSGRAGRAGNDGVAILVAAANPLDAYLIHHPEAIFDEGVEVTTFDPGNPHVLAPHLCAAAYELPLTDEDIAIFGLPDDALLSELKRRGLLRRRPTGWYWNYAQAVSPANLTDLRGGDGGRGVTVVDRASGTVLGTVDGGRADAVVHPGAVYVHQGATFVVDELTDDAALVHAEQVAHRTMAITGRHAELQHVRGRAHWGPVTWAFGEVEITSQVQGYDIHRPPSMEVLGTVGLEMPRRVLPTIGVWWSVSAEVLCEQTGLVPGDLPGALHAAEHAAIGVLGLVATCDRWDIGGISTALHPDTGAPTVLVYDGYPGGAGFAERGFHAAPQWVEATRRAVASCRCLAGCPRCIYSPKCGNGNHPLDKTGAIAVLDFLGSVAPRDI